MKSSIRIQKICSYINNSKCVIDIGSDHAFLSISLLKEKKSEHVINVDKNSKPLENGINNLTKENLVSKTTNILSDGFENVDAKISIDCCVISGLGDKTMIKILKKNKSKISKFILVPNNNPFFLRKFLLTSGRQKIINEEMIFDSGIYYFLIHSRKSFFRQAPSYKNCLFGPKNIKNNQKEFIDFLCERKEFIEKTKIADVNTKIKKELKIIERFLAKKCLH